MSKIKIAVAVLIAASTAAPAAPPTAELAAGKTVGGGGVSCWESLMFTGVGMPDVGPLNRGTHWQPCF